MKNSTEIEKLKQENKELKNELSKIRNESTQYLQNVAHQLTAPLNAIKWSIEAIKDTDIPLQRKMSLLRSVYSQATILVHLIKNFTLMSNLEAEHDLSKSQEQPREVDIMRLAINLANDFQPQAADSNKKILVDDESFTKMIGERKLLVEKNLIAQAISNILENGVKYSKEETKITIKANKEAHDFILSITSYGVKIEPEETDKLFERSYRGDAARQKVPAGTGFGLYLATRVMELHNGKIKLEIDGNKSTFSLVFPAKLIQWTKKT